MSVLCCDMSVKKCELNFKSVTIPNFRHGVSEGWKTAFEYIVTEVQTLMLKEYNHPLSFDLKV